DAAGNTSTAIGHFTLDLTAPDVSVTGVSDGEISNKDSVTPRFSSKDANPGSTQAILDGAPFASGAPIAAEGTHVLIVTWRWAWFPAASREVPPSRRGPAAALGVAHALLVTSADGVGNQAQRQVTFT